MHNSGGVGGRDVVAIAVAAGVSGLPSTVHAIATRGDALEAANAAGTLVPGRRDEPSLAAGITAHLAISIFWGAVIRVGVRYVPRHRLLFGAVAGASIAALDLGVVGRRLPALAALPQAPQWADHIAFGVVAASMRP
jgi:hypothetical protein